MEFYDIRDLDYTEAAWESLYDAVDATQFLNQDAHVIYDSLKHRLKLRSFGDYLKRYIYQKAGLEGTFTEVPLKDYQSIIKSAFADNHTPPSFTPTTAKLSALSKNWLTQQTVRRSVVFLLGFGLSMSVEDVNMFLTKALREQQINPKDPFEVICWYCYKRRFNYLKFEQLWQIYQDTPANSLNMNLIYSEQTIGVRNSMHAIHDDAALMAHLTKLKSGAGISKMSLTARQCFLSLYNQSRDLIAKAYNKEVERAHRKALGEYVRKLSMNDRLSDQEKQDRIGQFHARKKLYRREDITESDMENMICAAIPKDRHGNLTPSKASKLNDQFSGKRFSRQRISDILSGDTDVTRFDLITLNFFLFSQSLEVYPEPKNRYIQFQDATNAILEKCCLGPLYVPNPYECFLLMCILSDEPLSTYADVWELSYNKEEE